jgi:flagellar basal body-associated protein FliL
MAPLTPPEKSKKGKLLLISIVIAIVAVVIIAAAVVGYLYMDDQNKKSHQREALKQAFSDRQNETARLADQIGNYPKIGNKNLVDEYQKWVDGYRKLADNYSQAVQLLAADAATYQCVLANESTDYASVASACIAAKDKARSYNSIAAEYEREFQARLGLENDASAAFNLALDRSNSLYQTAWSLMQDNANYWKFGGYLAYLKACADNNTYYKNSISQAESAGVTYQNFLDNNEYYKVNLTIAAMNDNVTKLSKRYAELQKTNVTLTIMDEQLNQAWSGSEGLYTTVTFYLRNENKIQNIQPSRVWNIKIHFKLIDEATGAVRSECDVSVPEFTGSECNPVSGKMASDQGHTYRTESSMTFEY